MQGDEMGSDPIEWHPARLLQGRAEGDRPPPRLALIVLNQPLRDVATLKSLWENSSIKVAADGGANRLLDVCRRGGPDADHTFDDLDVIIGDLDSLTADARAFFASRPRPARIIHDPDQESTDFGKAVRHVRDDASASTLPPPDIVAMGSLGGRVDQGLSQLHHLYLYQTAPGYAQGRMFLVSGESLTFLLKAGRHRIHVREAGREEEEEEEEEDVFAKWVGIVPIKEPSVISTRGLEWDVTDWETEFGGRMSTSNHVLPETEVVEVATTKDVLFTIALKG